MNNIYIMYMHHEDKPFFYAWLPACSPAWCLQYYEISLIFDKSRFIVYVLAISVANIYS